MQELYASLKEKNPQFQGDNCPALPDLPGRKLFGRTEVHQVAEKRRVKIEEFCEVLAHNYRKDKQKTDIKIID